MVFAVLVPVAEFFVVVAVALAAVLLRTIDGRGFLASVGVGFAIVFGGGITWFIMVAVFFILGVVFTLYQYGYKKKIGGAQEKGGARNWPNILANGGVSSAVALVNFVAPSTVLTALFLGSVSAAAADTGATELGLLSKRPPRLLTHPTKIVPPGTSGGVTSLGFAGAIICSAILGAMAYFLGVIGSPIVAVGVCLVGGLSGAAADSVLGAALQRKGYCPVCMKPTESLRHCGEVTVATSGAWFVENNIVNLMATVAGALASMGAWTALTQIW